MGKRTIYDVVAGLGLSSKDVDRILSNSVNQKIESSSSADLYKAGTDYGTVSPNDVYKAGTYYGTVSSKDVYKAGTYYGTISIRDF